MLTPMSLISSAFLSFSRTAAYKAVDTFLSLNTYDCAEAGHITLAAANEVASCLKANIHRDPILACMADREIQFFGELLETVEKCLSDDDTRTRRMACLALESGGEAAHDFLVNALAIMPPDRAEDLRSILRIANGFG